MPGADDMHTYGYPRPVDVHGLSREQVWPANAVPPVHDDHVFLPAGPHDHPSQAWLHAPEMIDWYQYPPRFYPTEAAVLEVYERFRWSLDPQFGSTMASKAVDEADQFAAFAQHIGAPELPSLTALEAAQALFDNSNSRDELNLVPGPASAIQPVAPNYAPGAVPSTRPGAPRAVAALEADVLLQFTVTLERTAPKYGGKFNKHVGTTKEKATLTGVDVVFAFTTRSMFLASSLNLHGIGSQYTTGPERGPIMLVQYWGSGGWITVDTDPQFAGVLRDLLSLAGNRRRVKVSIDFDKLAMFRVAEGLLQASPVHTNLGHNPFAPVPSPYAPTASDGRFGFPSMQAAEATPYSHTSEHNAPIIMRLQQAFACQMHKNESGGTGLCYVHHDSGKHYFLNMWALKSWAAWISSNPAIDEQERYAHPPAELLQELDRKTQAVEVALHPGRVKPVPRGRTGPYPASTTSSNAITSHAPSPSAAADTVAIISAVMQPLEGLFANLSQPRSPAPSMSAPSTPVPSNPASSTTSPAPTTPSPSPSDTYCAMSPAPAFGQELVAFLDHLHVKRGVITHGWQAILEPIDFTPDVIASEDISVAELEMLLGITRGIAIKVKQAARMWLARLEAKHECL